jgi:DNA-binding beta-propeller fold protein YncE
MTGKLMLLLAFILFAQAGSAQRIDTIAGGGPDNLPALSANLDSPQGVAVDRAGNVFIADSNLNRIFKVDAWPWTAAATSSSQT